MLVLTEQNDVSKGGEVNVDVIARYKEEARLTAMINLLRHFALDQYMLTLRIFLFHYTADLVSTFSTCYLGHVFP